MDDEEFLLFAEMRMPDPLPTFVEVVKRIRVRYSDFAYLHIIEPTPDLGPDGEGNADSSKPLRDIWGDGAYIANSEFGRDSAIEVVEREGGLVSFSRHFISNVSNIFFLLLTCRDTDPSRLTA